MPAVCLEESSLNDGTIMVNPLPGPQLLHRPRLAGRVGLVMLTPPQGHRASGSKAHRPADFCTRTHHWGPRAGPGGSVVLSLALSVPPSRVEGNFLRNLASLTGGRYHCLVGEDLVSHIHRLLKSFLHDRVGCGATEMAQ